MQIKFSPTHYLRLLSFNSRQLLLSALTGTAIASTSSVLAFNNSISLKINESINKALEKIALTSIGQGINSIGKTFKSWATIIASSKDDFKEWSNNYLNPEGFKSGFFELYEKLNDWGYIVYNWFATKFLEFIKNIPEMVENWKKLRFSLFKWGTFLGGGGGSALWAMLGSGDNWGKLSALMGHPNFEEMMNDFNTLVQNNPDAFDELGAEGIQEIIEEYLEDPDKARQDAKELIEDQKKKEEEAKEKKENEEEKSSQLTAEEIKEKFSKQKGGKPSSPEEALWGFMGAGLKSLLDKKHHENAYLTAKNAMEEHFKHLENESQKNGKTAEIKKQFVDNVKASKNDLINAFAGLATKAFNAYNSYESTSKKPEMLSKFFEEYFKQEYTTEGEQDSQNAVEIDGKIKI